jgi:hypothetical protein
MADDHRHALVDCGTDIRVIHALKVRHDAALHPRAIVYDRLNREPARPAVAAAQEVPKEDRPIGGAAVSGIIPAKL